METMTLNEIKLEISENVINLKEEAKDKEEELVSV